MLNLLQPFCFSAYRLNLLFPPFFFYVSFLPILSPSNLAVFLYSSYPFLPFLTPSSFSSLPLGYCPLFSSFSSLLNVFSALSLPLSHSSLWPKHGTLRPMSVSFTTNEQLYNTQGTTQAILG